MTTRRDPHLFGPYSARTCARVLPNNSICGAVAAFHMLFDRKGNCGLACEEHAMDAIKDYNLVQIHRVDPPTCFHQNAFWNLEANVCVIPNPNTFSTAREAINVGEEVSV